MLKRRCHFIYSEKVIFHEQIFLLKRTDCEFSISEIRSIFSVYKGVYLQIFYSKTTHCGLIHKGPWTLSAAAAFSFQAVLPSEALSCEQGRSRVLCRKQSQTKESGNGICRNQHATQEARAAEGGNAGRKAVG